MPSIINPPAVFKTTINGVIQLSGSAWYDGSGVPSNSLGNDGDYYINLSNGSGNGDVYKKIAGVWELRGSISGGGVSDTFFRPGGIDSYFRPDGTSTYLRA